MLHRGATGFVTFACFGYTVASISLANGAPLDSTDLLRLVGMIGALILVVPGVIYAFRDRRRALRNLVIWAALGGVCVLLFWLMVRA